MSIYKIRAIYSGIGAWTALGVFRGFKSYDYVQSKPKNRSTFLYSVKFLYGLGGGICYVCPLLLPITFAKEIYRAEVVLRGLEEDKKTYYYNEIF